jgi:PAS domain S-box-containing protein
VSAPIPEENVNILVVDDRPENVLALTAILTDPTYNVVTANTGAEALKKILKHDFAMVLLDVLMPAMDGFETARLIFEREASKHIPIIFLTAAGADVTTIYTAYQLGAVDYLVKPIEPEIVKAKVAVFADLYRKSRRLQRQEKELRWAERALNQQVLSEHEAEFQATFEKAAAGIAHVGTDGRCLRVNQRLCEIIGYPAKDALKLRLQDIVHPEEFAAQSAALEQILAGERESDHSEVRFLHRSGSPVWVDTTVSLLRDAKGQAKKFIVIVEDASRRKHAEAGQRVLAEASEILLASIDSKPTLAKVANTVVPVLADWCVIELTSADAHAAPERAFAHMEYSKAEQLQKVFGGFAGRGGQRPRLISDVTEEQLKGWSVNPTDQQLWRELEIKSVIIVPLMVRGGQLGSITFISSATGRRYDVADVTIAEDLAHRVALGLENARLYQEAQDAIGARDEFLSIASHELRTPLTPLQIQLQRLLGVAGKAGLDHMPKEQVRGMLQRSAIQVSRLATLIDSLLDVSRITAGRFHLELEQVDLLALAREVIARFNEAATAGGSLLTLTTSDPVSLRCDPLRVEQVLSNLLSNAIKYGNGQPIEVRVGISGEIGTLVVADKGIGIGSDKLPKIFDRFERGEAARSYAGLGLGLYIAKQIVEAHHGSIRVSSEPGKGSVFTVEVPLNPKELTVVAGSGAAEQTDEKIVGVADVAS